MRLVWANLGKAITAAGGSLKDLVKTTVYVVGTDTLPAIRRARLDLLPDEGRPASTMVVVAALADPSFLVEVDAIAVLGGD
jgi:enamine deaminase RidA (YjgF/YER057c/UK114 family)